jgi:hypothetical protein
MKKVVRLSENDLNRLVKRVIKENHWSDDDFDDDFKMKAHAWENKKRIEDEKYAKMPTEKEVSQVVALASDMCRAIKRSGESEGIGGFVNCSHLSNIIEKYPRFQGFRF